MSKSQRRTFLRGLGTCIALPAFESLLSTSAYAQEVNRRRLVMAYMPNGFTTGYFSNSSGLGVMPSHTLAEVAEHNADLQVLAKLHNPLKGAYDQDFHCGHQASTTSFFNAMEKNGGSDSFFRQKTWDNRIAERISATCPIPAICMEIGPWRPNINFQLQQFSYVQDNVPLEHQTDLQAVYARLTGFGKDPSQVDTRDLQLRAEKKKVLDLVVPEIRTLQGKLTSATDREKLEQYLSGIESIEARLSGTAPSVACDLSSLAARASESDSYGFSDRQALVYDLSVAMLACDLTRVILIAGGDNDWEFNGTIPGLSVSNWHGASHDHLDSFKAMETYTARGFSSFLSKLKSHDDLGASLLARSAVLYMTDMTRDDDPHRGEQMSYLLAGQADGLYRRGTDGAARVKTLDKDVYHLWLTMMQDFGLEASSYGLGSSSISELRT